jgi:hypothetical protein
MIFPFTIIYTGIYGIEYKDEVEVLIVVYEVQTVVYQKLQVDPPVLVTCKTAINRSTISAAMWCPIQQFSNATEPQGRY